jgi:hypothetical protein
MRDPMNYVQTDLNSSRVNLPITWNCHGAGPEIAEREWEQRAKESQGLGSPETGVDSTKCTMMNQEYKHKGQGSDTGGMYCKYHKYCKSLSKWIIIKQVQCKEHDSNDPLSGEPLLWPPCMPPLHHFWHPHALCPSCAPPFCPCFISRASTAIFNPVDLNLLIWKQISLAWSYAPTFNGCQGLTVQKLGLELWKEVFSHGQLYSVMACVPNSQNVLTLKYQGDTSTCTTNIV